MTTTQADRTTAPATAAANGLAHTDNTPLETGWLATTPDGDNIVVDATRAMVRGHAALATAAGYRTGFNESLGLSLVDTGSPSPFGNICDLTKPIDHVDRSRLAEEVRNFFGGTSGGPFILFTPWPTGDLGEIGLSLVGHPPLMVHWNPAPWPVAGLDIRIVETQAELDDFERTAVDGYPIAEVQPWQSGAMFAPKVLDSSWRFAVGYVDGVPVATAASFTTDRVTLVEMVATLERARGHGYGAAVTAAVASSEPGRPAVLVASDLGRPVYAGLGFVTITRFSAWIGTRSGIAT